MSGGGNGSGRGPSGGWNGGTGGGTGSGTSTPPTTGGTAAPFKYGQSSSGTFDPKTFGTSLFNDVSKAYKMGPQATIPSFNPFTTQTRGLIDQGLGQVAANASGPLADYASGKYLDGSNDPYFNANLQQTRDNALKDVGAGFTNSGRFGGGSYVDTAVSTLANTENAARSAQLDNEWAKMLGAQSAQSANTATGLGYSGLLDSKNAEKIASDQQQQQQQDPYNYIAKYLGLLNSGTNADNTNKPLSWMDILGGIGSVAGAIL